MGVDMGELRGTHVPVLLERCLELLAPACELPRAVHVDFTLGLGGHAEAVLERFPDVTLVGLDRDREALEHSRQRLDRFAGRTHLVHAVYDELPEVLDDLLSDRALEGEVEFLQRLARGEPRGLDAALAAVALTR